jgi:hypothetical protein
MVRTVGLLFDPHIVAGDRRSHDGVAVVTRAIEKLNEVGVDWTLIGGDFRSFNPPHPSLHGTDWWGSWDGDQSNYYWREDFRKAKALFDDRLEGPYYAIRGNNDRPLSVFREFFPEEEYPQWFWFVDDGARYVFLDSNPDPGYHLLDERQNFVSAPQLSMLERLMDADADIPTFVFCHTPLTKHRDISDGWDVGKGSAYWVTLNYPSVQHILERGNTVAVNSGHYYGGEGRESKTVDGIEYITARHLVHGSDPEYGGDVRWMTIDAESETAEVRYYDVGADEEGTLVTSTW